MLPEVPRRVREPLGVPRSVRQASNSQETFQKAQKLPEASRKFLESSQKATPNLPRMFLKDPEKLPEAFRRLPECSQKAPQRAPGRPQKVPRRFPQASKRVPEGSPTRDA